MGNGLTQEMLIEAVKTMLGYPVIELFLEDKQIVQLINTSVRRCASRACPTFQVTRLVGNGLINMKDLDVEAVKTVYPSLSYQSSDIPFMAANSGDVFLEAYNYSMRSGTSAFGDSKKMLNVAYSIGRAANTRHLNQADFYLDAEGMLYVDGYSGSVTVEYVKKTITLEDLDIEWAGWVEQYTIACAKILEGRIRNKYKLTGGAIEVESDNLISEGTGERSELDMKLENSMGFYPISR
jgi:hypothetical protein